MGHSYSSSLDGIFFSGNHLGFLGDKAKLPAKQQLLEIDRLHTLARQFSPQVNDLVEGRFVLPVARENLGLAQAAAKISVSASMLGLISTSLPIPTERGEQRFINPSAHLRRPQPEGQFTPFPSRVAFRVSLPKLHVTFGT
ncbi:MAG: hypothetical protein DCF32_14180 [Leptolyngbya sp.]|nr:MAG: hypothetical protein DCF32_14180 [Leptolyngbya sp.]